MIAAHGPVEGRRRWTSLTQFLGDAIPTGFVDATGDPIDELSPGPIKTARGIGRREEAKA